MTCLTIQLGVTALLMLIVLTCLADEIRPTGKIKSFVGTLPPGLVMDLEKTDPYGLYPMDWVISPKGPVVIRREGPDGPTYQEALGYKFAINGMKFPRIVRLDDGRLILGAGAMLHPGYIEDPINYNMDGFIIYSPDEGQSWSQPKMRDHWGFMVNLGGDHVLDFHGERIGSSRDGGRTWGDYHSIPPLPDGRPTYHHGSVLVEGNVISAIYYCEETNREWGGTSVLRRSHDGGKTWPENLFLPTEWKTSEGSLTRAHDGALVATLRTAQAPGFEEYSDHWRRITTARSSDNGKTWTDHQVHFRFGKVHATLLTLPSGDILMTYIARIGELDGMTYHGTEAVLSRDHGRTWDWEHRYILFRWHNQKMHSPDSVLLSDGRILTIFQHDDSADWNNREGAWDSGKWKGCMNLVGNVSVVIWSPK